MTEAITQAAARAAFARRNGDEDTERYWTERVILLSDQEHALRECHICAPYDELKGSPDHSVVRHA